MKNKTLITSIKILSINIRTHIDCCNLIFTYIHNLESEKYYKELNFVYPKKSYLYLICRTHLESVILSLNSLINPKNIDNTEEISPFNKSLQISKLQFKQLNQLNHEFIELKLHKYRHNSIAHKILHISETEEIFNVSLDIKLFRQLENINIKFENWFYNYYPEQKEINLLTESDQNSLSFILGLMKTDRNNFFNKLTDMFLKN